jgi:hypothetical protein
MDASNSTVRRIGAKITQFRVEKPGEKPKAVTAPVEPVKVSMNEKLERPDMLVGSTYKMKTPVSDHAMYVTINDIVLNEDTPHEHRRPFEIFINSKNLDHFQWIVALTRVMSAVFRKGGDVAFLVEELKAVFDPKGGYWQSGGRYMPSLIAELGHIVERHLESIGLIEKPQLDAGQVALIAEKRAQFEAQAKSQAAATGSSETGFPPGAQLCPHCHVSAMVLMDGCQTCLSCAQSKCG